MKKEKPTVQYRKTGEEFIELGRPAFVYPVDHPGERVSNTSVIRTSRVVSVDERTGVFETLNTQYVPEGWTA